jgi:hypothetical protein
MNKPSLKSLDPTERNLAIQILKWSNRYKHGLLDKSIVDSFVKNNVLFWLLPVDLEKESNNKCIKLCQFIIKNKKTPNYNSTDAEEKRLSTFLSTKRKAALKKSEHKLYQSDLDILNRYNMEYLFDETPESRSNNTCILLCEYIIKNKKYPSQYSRDPKEKSFATFLKTKRQAASGKGECRIYKSDLEILKSHNLPDLFKTKGA